MRLSTDLAAHEPGFNIRDALYTDMLKLGAEVGLGKRDAGGLG
jgi:hypothetical protein